LELANPGENVPTTTRQQLGRHPLQQLLFPHRITHFPFHFPLDASRPNFFTNLDKWEKDDDRNFYKISSFLYMSAPSADYGPLSIARLKELTGLGETPENPIEVD
jgi:hypothetical protein